MKRLRYWLKYKIWHIYQFQGTNRASRVEKTVAREKIHNCVFRVMETWRISEREIRSEKEREREREFSLVHLNGILLLYWEYFSFLFFFFLLPRSETVESDYDTRENPNSFWNGQFPLEESEKNEFRGESDKNISWYINRFDIECNNRKEYSFFFIVVCAFIYHYTIRYYYKNKRIEDELLLSCDTIRLCPPVITV